MPEQRNAYQGSPLRPWIRLTLIAADGSAQEIAVLADTGNPCAIIVGADLLSRFNLGLAPGMNTNFGPLDGAWLRIRIPDLNFDESILAYGSNAVVDATCASHDDFIGLAGLPLLRLFEYGGNSDDFGLRQAPMKALAT